MKTGMNNLWAVLFGVGTILVLSLVMSSAVAALVGGGTVPLSAAGVLSWIITAVCAVAGALVCAGKAGEKRLPLCLGTGLVYLLLVFVLRGLIYGEVAETPWIIPICVLVGCVTGALLSSGRKKRRY